MDLRFDLPFFHLLTGSYRHFIGRSLALDNQTEEQAVHWLYEEAAFAILAHDSAPDPVFMYGNRSAQRLFGYEWEELIALPSRLSAELPERSERQRFLERVTRDGFVAGYSGIRIAKSGRRFRIENATVWQLIDAGGVVHGQAALLPNAVGI